MAATSIVSGPTEAVPVVDPCEDSGAPQATVSAPTSTVGQPTATTFQEQAEESLRLQIAADYIGNFSEADAVVASSCLEQLDERLAAFLEPGSAAFLELSQGLRDRAVRGTITARNTPDLYSVVIVSVELVGSAPYTEAVVVACETDNRRLIVPADRMPTGAELILPGNDEVQVAKFTEPMRLTDHGWVRYISPRQVLVVEGSTPCPEW